MPRNLELDLKIEIYIEAVRRLGRTPIRTLRGIGLMGIFLGNAIFYCLAPPLKFYRLLKQIHFIGLQSAVVIILTGTFTGMVMGLQGFYTLSRLGSEAFLGPMVSLTVIKELGPVISGLMVTGRAGSAITAEIGVMRMTDQIDALELMGLNPYRYLVVPNLLAGVIALPLLTAVFDVVGVLGGYLVSVHLLGVEAGTYFGEIPSYLKMRDVMQGVYKSLSFGVIITWICCYKGYHTGIPGYHTEGVGKATTQAVVLSSVLILIWDYFMTSILF